MLNLLKPGLNLKELQHVKQHGEAGKAPPLLDGLDRLGADLKPLG